MDATSYIARKDAPYDAFARVGKDELHLVDVKQISGLEAIGAHDLVVIPVGKALVDAKLIILTDAASAGAATVKMSLGTFDATAAIALADLTAGSVIDLMSGATATCKGYAKAAAFNVKMTVAVADLTAFKFLLVTKTIDMDEVLTNG